MSDRYVGQCLCRFRKFALQYFTLELVFSKNQAMRKGCAAVSRLAMVLLECSGGLLSAVLAGLQPSRSESCLWGGGCLADACLGAVVWRQAGQAGGRFFLCSMDVDAITPMEGKMQVFKLFLQKYK